MKHNAPPRPTAARAVTTEDLMRAGGSDISRWANPANLAGEWNKRAHLAASFIPAGSSVIDIGAGAMALRHCLPPGCPYTPADVVAREPGCLTVDLNAGDYPSVHADWTTFLGVLEYVHNPEAVLRQAAKHSTGLILSYVCHTRGSVSPRRGMGWVNDYNRHAVVDMLGLAGWSVEAERVLKLRWRNTERLFICRRA